jgi:cytochrome b561
MKSLDHIDSQYDSLSQLFHWITAILVLTAFFLGPGNFGQLMQSGTDPGSQPGIVWHETIGIAVFAITVIRLIWIAIRPISPRHQVGSSMILLSRLMHLALIALLLALPITALLALSSEGYPLTMLGGVRIETFPWNASSQLSKFVDWGDVHKTLGDAMIWMAGIHASAAIFHHVVRGDNVLSSMLPRAIHRFIVRH